MSNKFFGSLSIVVGVFVLFAGGCFLLLGTGPYSAVGVIIGIVLIATGIHMLREPDDGE